VKERAACAVAVIGEITAENPGQVTVFDENRKPVNPGQKGWEHFISI